MQSRPIIITALVVILLGAAAFVVWRETALAPTVTENSNTNTVVVNTNQTVATNTSTSANVNSGVSCTTQADCSSVCASTQCSATAQLYYDCTANQCQCACLENGPEDTVSDPSIELYNGSVSTACVEDGDCTIVNRELDYRVCFAGYCTNESYAADKYVAVNASAFTAFSISLNDGGSCGAQPACTLNSINTEYRGSCIDSVCHKVKK